MRCRYGKPPVLLSLLPLLLMAVLAGCAQHDLDLGRGGFSAEDSARLSLALAQVRAQAPAAKVSALPYSPRPEPEGLPEPELALSGEAVGLSRGFQVGEKSRLRLAVYLDKSSYTRGYAKVARDGGAEEVWRIVAYELRGQADRDFQFTYLLADPAGNLRTLMLLGGGYQEKDAELVAIEGALFFPDPEPRSKRYSPAEWATAFPFAFVLKDPATPAYVALTTQADGLFREIDREVPDLERLAQKIDALAATADAAPAPDKPPGDAAPSGAAPAEASTAGTPKPAATADAQRKELERQLRQRAALAQAKAVHYYQVRAEADSAFAAYLGTNGYVWRDADGQQDAFTKWDVLNKQADTFDDRVSHLLPFVPEPQKLEQARDASAAVIAKNKNASKRPAVTKS